MFDFQIRLLADVRIGGLIVQDSPRVLVGGKELGWRTDEDVISAGGYSQRQEVSESFSLKASGLVLEQLPHHVWWEFA